MPIAEVPTLMFQPKMLEIALPCIWLPMMDMWRHHLIDHATSCHSMNCPVSWCDGRALADCRYCRLLGFCSKLALMRMPNALEAGSHFSSSNVHSQFVGRLQHYPFCPIPFIAAHFVSPTAQEQRKTLSVKGTDVCRTLKPPVDPN